MFSTAAPSRAQASAMLPGRIAWSPSALLQGPTALAPRRVQAKPQKSVASAMLVVGAASTTTLLSTSSSPSSTSSSSSSPSPSRRPRSSVAARAAAATSPSPPPLAPGPEEDAWRPGDALTPFMADRKRWLEGDLPHLFDDVGIDRSGYAEVVEFRDPITSYDSLQGYLFNIAALRRVFSPAFVLLDVRQTAPRDLTTRWAMEMTVAGGGLIPGPLRPKLSFTGTSILTFDGKGKICKHVDTWDALDQGKDQDYFSVAGFRNVLAQLTDVRKPPAESSPSPSSSLWSPPKQLLRKTASYEIRRYDDLSVIESPMTTAMKGEQEGGVTGPGARSAFRALASFITKEKISMTTPVLSDARAMRFVLTPGEAESRARAAAASSSTSTPSSSSSSEEGSQESVSISEVKGGIYAVAAFGGIATDAASAAAVAKLKSDLARDGVKVSSSSSSNPPYLLAQYNGPVTLPPFRLNEVLLPLDAEAFDLWKV